ncbi:MAG: hypothetical protein ACW99G_02670 [Candidatus Thorarchaeota archaeon]|jgi:hypothetical protein
MASTLQEFYCGECSGYFRVKLNLDRDYVVWMVCPECGHKHKRAIDGGVIKENGRENSDPAEEIVVMKSAYSKEPWTKKMQKAKEKHEDRTYCSARRDGVIVKDGEKPKQKRDPAADEIIRQSWLDRFGDRT